MKYDVGAPLTHGAILICDAVTASRTQDIPADIPEEQALERIAQLSNGGRERQPFDRHDVLHKVTAWVGFSLHAPELHDLRPTARPVRDGTDEFAHPNAVSGLFDELPARAYDRALIALEFAT